MKKDDTYRSQFRLPYDLYEKLKAESEKNRRSLNAEIVARLQRTIELDEREAELERIQREDMEFHPDTGVYSNINAIRRQFEVLVGKLDEMKKDNDKGGG